MMMILKMMMMMMMIMIILCLLTKPESAVSCNQILRESSELAIDRMT